MNIGNKEEKGLGTYPDISHRETCEICQKLPAHRHYNHYFLCTSCFIALLEKERKSHTGGNPYVHFLRCFENKPLVVSFGDFRGRRAVIEGMICKYCGSIIFFFVCIVDEFDVEDWVGKDRSGKGPP